MPKELTLRQGSQNVVVDEFEDLFFLSVLLQRRILYIGVDHDEVVFSLPHQRLLLVVFVSRHVFQQQFPRLAPKI